MKKWFFILCIATAASAAFWLRTPVDPDTAHQQQVVTHHLRNLAYGDYETRNDSRAALLSIGAPATQFIVHALDDRPGLIDRAAARLGRRVSWLRITPTTDHQIRQRAAEQLAASPLGEHPTAVPALIRALTDDSSAVVEQAQQSLRRIGSDAAIPALTQALQSRNKSIRFHAAEVLRDMGTDASRATSALVLLLRDRDPTIRVVSAHALGNIGNTPALQALVATLADKSPAVRAAAVTALGIMDQGAISSAPQIRQRLADRDLRVRVAAARALWQITGEAIEAVPVLVAALKEPNAWDSALALGAMREAASNAVPALIDVIQREKVSRPLREMPVSALALGKIGAPAVPGLIEVTAHPDPRVRTSAAMALGLIGGKADAALPHLVPLLRDSNADVRRAATLAIGNIDTGQHVAALVPALIKLASDEDIFLSSLAASTLERVDPEAAASVRRE
jgi:HEAT repeat protein